MNQRNYQFLSDTLDNLGFTDDKLKDLLKQKIDSNLFDEFGIPAKANVGKDKMEFELFFIRSNDPSYQDYFNLNHVKLDFTPENGETIKIKFPHYKNLSFNTEQMFLMAKQNAPVYKKGRNEKIGQWAKVDTKNTDDDGFLRVRTNPDDQTNFNLERHLDNLKVKWARGEKEEAMMDLQNGLPVKVTIRQNGVTESATIKVGPQINSLIMLNSENKEIQRTNTSSISVQAVDEVKNENKVDKSKQIAESMNKPKEGKGPKTKIA